MAKLDISVLLELKTSILERRRAYITKDKTTSKRPTLSNYVAVYVDLIKK